MSSVFAGSFLPGRPNKSFRQHELALRPPNRDSRHRALTRPLIMTDPIAIHGHDIIDLVASYPDGIRLSQLMETVDERFGKAVTFHTCSAMGMDLDGLLRFLEAHDKVRITSGVVYPGGSPACEH
jgi:probable metal-binding protein